MKLTAKDIPAFLTAPAKTARGCVVYGADEGQVRDTARQILRKIMGENADPMNLTELTGANLKEDPAKLADALNSYSLMGGDRLVWLRDPLETQAEDAVNALVKGNPAAYLLITCDELKPTSKWRSLFEKEKLLAALPCYRDEGQQLSRFIGEGLRARGIQANAEVVNYLASQLGNDRGVTQQEIEKLDIFLGEERRLSLAQTEALCGDNREITLDDLCHAVCGGQPAQLPSLLARMMEDGTQPIGIFRILHGHFQRLRQMQMAVAEGTPLDQVFNQQRIFFKQQPRLRDQLRRWNDASISRASDALLEAERKIKTAPVAPELFCNRLLHRLCLSAKAA